MSEKYKHSIAWVNDQSTDEEIQNWLDARSEMGWEFVQALKCRNEGHKFYFKQRINS